MAERRLIVCADDFGRDIAVNEAVERACRDGILTCASLMVAAPAAADAVARARRLPRLRVGLHLVLIDGEPVLPPAELGGLARRDGRFDPTSGPGRAPVFLRARHPAPGSPRRSAPNSRRFARPGSRSTMSTRTSTCICIRRSPGCIVEIGREYGMRAVRLPAEPAAALRAAFPGERYRTPLYRPAVAALRRRLRRAGLAANDHVFGIAWSGAMVEGRILRLLPHLPAG